MQDESENSAIFYLLLIAISQHQDCQTILSMYAHKNSKNMMTWNIDWIVFHI